MAVAGKTYAGGLAAAHPAIADGRCVLPPCPLHARFTQRHGCARVVGRFVVAAAALPPPLLHPPPMSLALWMIFGLIVFFSILFFFFLFFFSAVRAFYGRVS